MGQTVTTAPPRLLFLITEDWTFWEIRRDLARAARDAGYDVRIATRVADHAERIRAEGFRLIPISLVRSSRSPFSELKAFLEIVGLYRDHRPHIVHHVAIKPILYGSLAAWWTGVPVVVNAFAGLGYAFTDRPEDVSLLRRLLQQGLKLAIRLSCSTVVFQNKDDKNLMVQLGIVDAQRSCIVAGSGVDITRFVPTTPSLGRPIVMLPGRMLWDKGIGEFVEAVKLLRRRAVDARFVLVGRIDRENPTVILEEQLHRWGKEEGIEWWGHREDMPETLGQATIVVLPSYREGLPKVLLEAAACGKPLLATDVPGCREVVRHGETGLLIEVRNPVALANGIQQLLSDAPLRERLGKAAREYVVREHSIDHIGKHFLELYQNLRMKAGGRSLKSMATLV